MHLLVRFPLLFSLCLMVPHVHGVFLLCFVTITIPIPSNTKCKVSDLQKSVARKLSCFNSELWEWCYTVVKQTPSYFLDFCL